MSDYSAVHCRMINDTQSIAALILLTKGFDDFLVLKNKFVWVCLTYPNSSGLRIAQPSTKGRQDAL